MKLIICDRYYALEYFSRLEIEKKAEILLCFVKETERLLYGIDANYIKFFNESPRLSEKGFVNYENRDFLNSHVAFTNKRWLSTWLPEPKNIRTTSWLELYTIDEICKAIGFEHLFEVVIVDKQYNDVLDNLYILHNNEMDDRCDLVIHEHIKGDFISNILPKIKEIVDIEVCEV